MASKSPILGMLLGAGIPSATAAAIRAFTTWDKWATAVGAATGAGIGFFLTMGRKTKSLGRDTIWASLIFSAPRLIEEVAAGGFSGMYLPEAASREMLGQPANVEVLSAYQSERSGYGTANIGSAFGSVPIAGIQ